MFPKIIDSIFYPSFSVCKRNNSTYIYIVYLAIFLTHRIQCGSQSAIYMNRQSIVCYTYKQTMVLICVSVWVTMDINAMCFHMKTSGKFNFPLILKVQKKKKKMTSVFYAFLKRKKGDINTAVYASQKASFCILIKMYLFF